MIAEPALWIGAGASYPASLSLKRKLTEIDSFDEEYRLWQERGGRLLVPRNLAKVGPETVDRMSDGTIHTAFESSFVARDADQAEAVAKSVQLLKAGRNHLLVAPTGTGKTVMGLAIAAKLNKPTLILVHKQDLFDSWVEDAKNILGLYPKDIGLIQADVCNVKSLTIGMVQSLAKVKRYPSSAYRAFGLVIADECFHPSHELLTEEGWKPVASITKADRVVAFDPTTSACRLENVERTVLNHFDGNLVALKGNKIDLLTTPGHEQPIRRKRAEGWVSDRITMGDLKPHSRIQLPVAGVVEGDGQLSAMERLAIAFHDDGTVLRRTSTGVTHRFMFRRSRKWERLTSLLDTAGIEYKCSINNRGDRAVWFKLPHELPKTFDWYDPLVSGARNEAFLNELIEWNGWIASDKSGAFYGQGQAQRSSVEKVQTIAQLAGYSANLAEYKAKGRATHIRVRWRSKQCWIEANGVKREEVPYCGPVYCVTVASGNVLTRRNGVISVSGNCHRLAADVFSQCMWNLPARYRLGLSATPVRKDGRTKVLTAHIGPPMVEIRRQNMVPKVLPVRTGWNPPYIKRNGSWVPFPYRPGRTMGAAKSMAGDMARNELIVHLTYEAYQKDRKIMVFSDLRDHLETLRLLLTRQVMSSKIGLYVGGLSEKQREKAAGCPIILTTYKMASEGTNIPDTDTCVLGTPKADVVQAVGRIRRIVEGKKQPVVFDLVDVGHQLFVDYYRARCKWYQSINAPIVEI